MGCKPKTPEKTNPILPVHGHGKEPDMVVYVGFDHNKQAVIGVFKSSSVVKSSVLITYRNVGDVEIKSDFSKNASFPTHEAYVNGKLELSFAPHQVQEMSDHL